MRVLVFSSLLLIAVTGCKPLWDPTFMPAGYAHHHKEYKTPPGPEGADIGYPYSAKQNQRVMQSWQNATSDLVLRAKANDIRPVGPVFLTTDLKPSAFQAAFDNALREELRAAGHTMSKSAEEATTLFYSAYNPAEDAKPESDALYNDELSHSNTQGIQLPPSKTMDLTLAVLNEGRMGKSVSAKYDVPLYGFKPTGYLPAYARPLPKLAEE